METKKCGRCKKIKSISEFYLRSDKTGPRSECIPCYQRKSEMRYGEDKDTWNDRSYWNQVKRNSCAEKDYVFDQYNQQDGRCAICNCIIKPPRDSNTHVDHDDWFKKPRGILCRKCNMGIGYFDDDPGKMYKAVKYLNQWHYKNVL